MSFKKDINISENVEGLLPLNDGGIFASQENLRQSVIYRLSHANDFLKYLYYTDDNPLINNDILDKNGEYIDRTLFDEEIRDEILFFDSRVPTDKPAGEVKSYFSMNLGCRKINSDIGEVVVEFDIIVHQEIISLNKHHSRIGMIGIELMNLFNHTQGKFLGTLEFVSGSDINVPERYRGYRMIFKATDLNR